MTRTRGASRLLLLGLVVAAATVVAASLIVVLRDDPLEDGPPSGDDGDGDALVVPGRGGARTHVDPYDDEIDDDDGVDDDGIVEWKTREPHGDVFTVTAESLRDMLSRHHWEEIRRQIDVLQQNGQEVPRDVVENLIALLAAPETRIDAVLALGGVTGAEAGRLLADHAVDPAIPLDARLAALDALARNGNAGARDQLVALLGADDIDPKLVRHGAPALAAIGGEEAARALTDLLVRLPDEHRERDAVLVALGKSPDAGRVLADTLSAARDSGTTDLIGRVIKVALFQGQTASAELRVAIRRVLDDPNALDNVENDLDRQKLRGSALAAAAAMGGELLEPVLRVAESDSDGLGGIALYSLRHARGDDAAQQIDEAARRATDPRVRRELVTALGETRSRAATGTLLRMLDDPEVNVRHAAARGLSLVLDPASVKPLLARLPDAKDDFPLARSYIDALGQIGAREALPRLEELRDRDDDIWPQVQPFIRLAIGRIESGNPNSPRMK